MNIHLFTLDTASTVLALPSSISDWFSTCNGNPSELDNIMMKITSIIQLLVIRKSNKKTCCKFINENYLIRKARINVT